MVSVRQWNNGGLEAYQKGRLEQAQGLFTRAADQAPNDYRVRANLARTYQRSGDTQSAILHMQQAVDLSNGDPKLAIELGEMYLQAGQWLPARRQVQLALESNHRFAPAWALSGKTEKAKGNYEQALADFQKAIGYSDDLPDVQMQIVDTYQKMNQPLRALSAVDQVLSRHPIGDQPEHVIIAKSAVLIELRQLGTAIDLLETASQNEKATSRVFVQLSRAQLRANQLSHARLTLYRGKQAFPEDPVFDQMASSMESEKPLVASAGGTDPTIRF